MAEVARDIREHVVKDVTQCHRCLYLLDEDMDHEVKDCELNRRSMSERDLNDICKLLKSSIEITSRHRKIYIDELFNLIKRT